MELRPWKRLRIVEYWNTDRYHNASSALLAENLLLGGSAPLTDQPLATDRLNLNYSQEEVDVYYDLTSRLTLRGGYRYEWGDTDVGAPILTGLDLGIRESAAQRWNRRNQLSLWPEIPGDRRRGRLQLGPDFFPHQPAEHTRRPTSAPATICCLRLRVGRRLQPAQQQQSGSQREARLFEQSGIRVGILDTEWRQVGQPAAGLLAIRGTVEYPVPGSTDSRAGDLHLQRECPRSDRGGRVSSGSASADRCSSLPAAVRPTTINRWRASRFR